MESLACGRSVHRSIQERTRIDDPRLTFCRCRPTHRVTESQAPSGFGAPELSRAASFTSQSSRTADIVAGDADALVPEALHERVDVLRHRVTVTAAMDRATAAGGC
jgi:hypothetical protein